MPITLPREPIPATTGDPRILTLYGPPKVGKTTICAALPNALMLDLENGSDYVSAMKLKAQSLAEFEDIINEIVKMGKPYQYLINDTIDKIEDWADVSATTKYRKDIKGKNFSGESVLELPNGGGYLYLRNEFRRIFNLISTAAPRIILIGHVRDKVINAETKDVTSKDLDLAGKVRNIVCSLSDAIGHIYRDKDGKLKISFNTTESLQCGSRCVHLRGKTISFSDPATLSDWKQIYTTININQPLSGPI